MIAPILAVGYLGWALWWGLRRGRPAVALAVQAPPVQSLAGAPAPPVALRPERAAFLSVRPDLAPGWGTEPDLPVARGDRYAEPQFLR